MSEKCFFEIEKLAGRTLSKKEREEVNDFVNGIVKRVEKEDLPGTLDMKVQEALNSMATQMEIEAVVKKRTAAINAKRRIDNIAKIVTHYFKDYAEGLKALLGESPTSTYGSKDTISANMGAEKAYQIGGLIARLDKERVLDIVKSKDFQKDLFYAMHEMSAKTPNHEFLNSLNPDIVKAAQILNNSLELSRIRFNKAGGFISKIESYVMKQSHDQNKIAKFAGKTIPLGDAAHKQAWMDFILPRLDMEKTYPGMDMSAKIKKIEEDFLEFSTGEHLKYQSGSKGFTGPANVAKKYSKSRQYQFKNKEAAFEYWQKAGRGEHIGENIIGQINRMARDTAIMNKFGVNAEANINDMVESLSKDLSAQGRHAEITKLRETHDKLMKTLWPNITDQLSSSPDNLWTAFNDNFRNFTYTVNLGAAVLSQVGDIPAGGLAYRYATSQDFGAFMDGQIGHMSRMMEHLSASEKIQTAAQLQILIDTMAPHPNRFDADGKMIGAANKYMEFVNKANLVGWWQDKSRIAGTALYAHSLANQRGFKWGELSDGYRSYMNQFGVTEGEWDLLRSSPIEKDFRDREMISPRAIQNVPLEKFDVLPEVQERIKNIKEKNLDNADKLINAARERARDRLHSKIGSLFSEYSSMVATEASAIDRSILNQGTKRGTIPGELLRALSMFKTFTLAFTRKHLGREVYGYHSENIPLHKAVQRLFEGGMSGKGIAGIASMAAVAPLYGYVSMALKDLSKGITPRYPQDPADAWKIWIAAAGQSGGLGYFGNFLFSDKTQYGQTLGQSLLGPGISNMTTIADLATEAFYGVKTGDTEGIKDTGAKITRFMLHNIPGANLFWTRLPFNLAVGYTLEEMANQGSLRRKEQRLKRNTGQEYFMKPSEWVNK